MKKQFIQLLIAVMAASIVALVGIQLYWINSAIHLQEEEFTRTVNEALSHVSDKLEKTETIRKVKSHQQGRYLFIDSDAELKLDQAGNDTSYDFLIVQEFFRDGEDVELRITEEHDGERITRVSRVEGGAGVDSLLVHEGVGVDFSFVQGEGEHYLRQSEDLAIRADSLLQTRVAQKRAFVGDIVKSLIEVDLFQPIEERLLQANLDSILRLELQANGIHAKYTYGVFDEEGTLRFQSPGPEKTAGLTELDGSEYHARLFPHDVVRNPYYLRVHFPQKTGYFLQTIWMMLVSSMLIIAAISYIFYYNVRTIIHQKRNSEIKNDFINNMTHELKTPISTISLACEALQDPDISDEGPAVSRYISMISDENKRLGLLVEEVLQSAVLDRGDFKLKLEDIPMHPLISEVVDKFRIQVREKQGQIRLDLEAARDKLRVDKVHLANVIYNLIDNANKYSTGNPDITVRTRNEGNLLAIDVSDQGVGISKEDQKRVFDKLFRVPTGNRHDVKGFGLGLSYVKIIVERLGGSVSLQSQLGKGSTFTVYIPVHENISTSSG